MGLRRRRAVLAGVAVATAVLLAGLSGAAAAPSTSFAREARGGHLPKIKKGTDAATLVDGTATVRKQKITVTLPRTELRTYANNKFSRKNGYLFSSSPAWAVTNFGKHPTFGIFPTTRTSVLGFGAIPITASLHLSQVHRGGAIVPIIVTTQAQTSPPFKVRPTTVRGLVDVRIAHVFVDQVPLHVGPDCHTSTPMHLQVVGISPRYNLFTGGPLHGKVTIPPFTGCGTHGDDLNPLLTGMVSGPGNRLDLIQGSLGTWNKKKPHDCANCRPPVH